jgi:large repetitive protein
MSMNAKLLRRATRGPELKTLIGVLYLVLIAGPAARADNLSGLTVIGVAPDGTETPVTDYRWLVEQDLTYHVNFDGSGNPISVPGSPGFDPNWENTLSVSFHRSYMPIIGKGCVNMPAEAACSEVPPGPLDPDQHYFVSVLPRSGHAIGGVSFKGGESRTVYVNQTPLPTAQISIFVFPDTLPLNGAPDTPSEDPAVNGIDMSGFKIILEDGGGRYGAASGIMSTDVYGNPLGTTYLPNCDPYNPNCIDQVGSDIVTGPDGWAHVYNLAQGKYGVTAVPPAGSGWVQTSTIEGTKINDAWVKPNEPPFFAEFGPPGPHVFLGFVKKDTSTPGGTPITGKVVNLHMSRPADYAFYNGACFGHTTPWVGLNDMAVGTGQLIYAAPTDGDCNFSIPGVPAGNYQLVIWDSALDLIISTAAVSIAGGQCNTPNGSCNLGEVPVFQWFTRQEHFVFNDYNGNGLWEPDGTDATPGTIDDEGPLPEVPLNLRWRDGTIYQTNVTDMEGAYAFDQVFPFFNWQVAEVGFTRLQATGVTVTVDNGGPINPANPWSYGGQLNPQDQSNPPDPTCGPLETDVCTETPDYRVERGPVLLEAFQGFIGQTSVFEWGKRHYPDGENGGITGIVFYDVTRAENDPELAAAEVWEPGIPGVTVNVYGPGPDNAPNTADDVLLNATVTDSWDDAIPSGCKYGNGETGGFVFSPDGVNSYPTDCYDGLRNFNQVRPGVFDGGYAFSAICGATGGLELNGTCPDNNPEDGEPDWVSPMPVGDYVVEVVPLPGYEIYKPEDKNVDFGDAYGQPTPALLPPPCVGTETAVPQYLTLYPDEQIEVVNWSPGMTASLCNKKLVRIQGGTNAAADFFLFTEVPVAAHGVGFILDDTQNEFDANAPNFGEKYAPPFMPVSLRDWTGREIGRTYSDQYGLYNFLVPSTATINVPEPSGVSPNMLTACMNDATLPDGSPDPHHNPIYSQFCYTLQYMPGVYTYLDTPVIPVGAFAGPDRFPVDCEFPDATPRIHSVTVDTNGVGGGPYVPLQNNGRVAGNQTITINALDADPGTLGAQVWVPNPDYCNNAAGNCPPGADTINKLIRRNSGFGSTPGTVALGGVPVTLSSWNDAQIKVTVANNTNTGVGGRQLTVTRADGVSTVTGLTVQFGLRGSGGNQGHVVHVTPDAGGNPLASPLQNAIDNAAPNDLLLVHPGIYNEMVIMWRPVQLQGFGEGSTKINALKQPTEKLATWRAKAQSLVEGGSVDLLPGQELAFGGIEPVTLMNEEGAGILVLARASGNNSFGVNRNQGARIDGFTITGADTGGGIVDNGYGSYLDISNNRVINNSGDFGGGIRVGHPLLPNAAQNGYEDGQNDYVRVHHNAVIQNGALDGAGAGISMGTGSDSYQVTNNWVCGNFSTGNGGGIGHIGVSNRAGNNQPIPLIADNRVLFNEIFNQGLDASGGGLFIGGAPPLAVGGLSPGAGNVQVLRNVVQGNGAGAGDGGGIRLANVNGQDVASNNNSNSWYGVDLFNNVIVNNVAGLAGGGISLQDAVKVSILYSTIGNNDSLGTAGAAFLLGSPNQSNAQPGAGIVTRAHSPQLLATGRPIGTFSDPNLQNSIVWHNRQFFFWVDQTSGCAPGDPGCTSTYGLCPDVSGALDCPGGNTVVYDNLGVIGAVGTLGCDGANCFTNNNGSPSFVRPYVNGARSDVFQTEITTAIQTPPAFDEGGNFIRPNYGPLTLIADPTVTPNLLWNYHLQSGSPAINAGAALTCAAYSGACPDIDGNTRPLGGGYDIGADEVAP